MPRLKVAPFRLSARRSFYSYEFLPELARAARVECPAYFEPIAALGVIARLMRLTRRLGGVINCAEAMRAEMAERCQQMRGVQDGCGVIIRAD